MNGQILTVASPRRAGLQVPDEPHARMTTNLATRQINAGEALQELSQIRLLDPWRWWLARKNLATERKGLLAITVGEETVVLPCRVTRTGSPPSKRLGVSAADFWGGPPRPRLPRM